MITITSDGDPLGTAESVGVTLQAEGFERPGRILSSTRYDVDLEGFTPAPSHEVNIWVEAYMREHTERLKAEKLAAKRGKTIYELTEKFNEKKRRIHDFYAPQLKNRAAENDELELAPGEAKELWGRIYTITAEKHGYVVDSEVRDILGINDLASATGLTPEEEAQVEEFSKFLEGLMTASEPEIDDEEGDDGLASV